VGLDVFCVKDREHWIGDGACLQCRWRKCWVWCNFLPEYKMLKKVLRMSVKEFG